MDNCTIKSVANFRTGCINPNCSTAKGDLFQELTCRWRSLVSTFPVEDLNKKYDNYKYPIDHSRDSELGIIQTKGRVYNSKYKNWPFGGFDRDRNKYYDYYICYCTDGEMKIIERIYIFPKRIINTDAILVYKYDSKGNLYENGWYEKYRITDENVLIKVNGLFKDILIMNQEMY